MPFSSGFIRNAFLAAAVFTATPAEAFRIKIPTFRDIGNALESIRREAEKVAQKAAKEYANSVRDILKEGKKISDKSFHELGNFGEDLRILVETGECRGDLCIALGAAVEFSVNNIKDTGDVLKETEKRLSEGKPLDAMWHLAVDPVNNQQENAAQAAMKSSVLRAVGQAAASTYGPGGAAAYAAWLTYHSTGENIELALKAGAIAGATAYAMDGISKDAALLDVAKDLKAAEVVQRSVMSGAVSGLAVAISGGTKEEIEQAFTKGAVTSLIRDGYKELTKSHLQDNMNASKGVAYCLGANPNAVDSTTKERLGCLPDPDEYITKDGKPVSFDAKGNIDLKLLAPPDKDGNYPVDFTKLDYARPHVGEWSKVAEGPFFGKGETSGFMTGVSRIPGMNGMSVAHDIFDSKFNPEMNIVVDTAFRVGTIAPFIVMTYEGTGFGVQEVIRNVNARSQKTGAIDGIEVPGSVIVDQADAKEAAPAEESKPVNALENSTPVEVRHLVCKRGDEPVKNFLMENIIPASDPAEYKRICRIDQHLGGDRWAHLWHAHHEKSFCTIRFNDMVVRQVERGYTCYENSGVRFDPANIQSEARAVAPAP